MPLHFETHRSGRSGWLRAAVLGADDGLVSTAALLVGLVAAGAARSALITAGVAALTAGASAMAIGEYVSVSAQADAERADTRREEAELLADPESELAELVRIYEERGLDPQLAESVAEALHRTDPLQAHLRDELGHAERSRARPAQAAGVSAASFALGSLIPLLTAILAPAGARTLAIAAVTIVSMCALGAVGARLGGAPPLRGALRVGIGGSAALAITYGVGLALGAAV
jgi:VIT1/CCC1 family predicted Fe2+/Mn2+ transporter